MKTTKILLILILWVNTLNSNAHFSIQPIPIKRNIFQIKFLKNEIKTLTLNTWGLPIPFHKANNIKRFERVVRRLNESDYGIICLQETFNKKLRALLATRLDEKFYVSGNLNCTRPSLLEMDCYGGLTTISIFPIVKEQFNKFPISDEYSLCEKIGSKGFLLTWLNIGFDTIVVVNTHLYAGGDKHAESIRLKQLLFMFETIGNMTDLNNIPLFYMGDFNVGHPNQKEKHQQYKTYDFLTVDMKLEDSIPNPTISDFSYNYNNNILTPNDEPIQKLDYFFKSCYINDYSIKKSKLVFCNEHAISDHSGVETILVVNKKPNKKYFALK